MHDTAAPSPTKKPKPSCSDVRKALRARYAPKEWVLVEELRNGTGFGRRRHGYADAVAFNCFPSRGLAVIGFEIKVSRSDWISELRKPEKAEEFVRYTDQWYVVVPDLTIVQGGELPVGWGLMLAKANGTLRTVTPAAARKGEPMDRPMVASLMRNLVESTCPLSDIQDRLRDAAATAREAVTQERSARLAELERKIERFEKASGVTLGHEWYLGDVGEAVRQLVQLRRFARRPTEALRGAVNQLVAGAQDLTRLMDFIDAEAKHFDAPAEPGPAAADAADVPV